MTPLALPDPEELSRKVEPYSAYQDGVSIQDHADYEGFVQRRAGAKKLLAEVTALYDPIQQAANMLLAKIRESRRKFEAPLRTVVERIDVALDRYEKQQAMARAQEEALLAAELEAEAQKVRAAEVKAMAKTGFVREAERLQAQPVTTPHVPVLPPAVPTVGGLQKRTLWEAQVVDKLALVKAVAEGKAPLECLDVNMACLNAMARAAKTALNIPGVKAVSKTVRAQVG